ncbi:Prefoldin, partial [Chytriomyces sp. MP71]
IETQEKHQVTSRQLANVRAQINSKDRDRKIGNLAAKELASFPPSTVAYKSVGKMFLQQDLSEMIAGINKRSEDAASEIKALARANEKLERDIKDLERGLTELLQRRMM